MAMIVKPGESFEPAPPGPSAAVCIDVVDLGTRETSFGARTQVRIVWSLEKRMKPKDRAQLGKPYLVQKTYTRSLHKKATLRVDLEAWRGRGFDEKALAQGFDLEKLLGKAAFLSIQHNERDGTTYANVVFISPLPDGMHAPLPDPTYVRHADRADGKTQKRITPVEEEPSMPEDEYAPAEENDDSDLPF